MAKRDVVEKAMDYASRYLAEPTAGKPKPVVQDSVKVFQEKPADYARTMEAYLQWEYQFWTVVQIALAVIFVVACGCFAFVAAFGNNNLVTFGGLASGLAGLLGLLFGNPAAKVQERRSALGAVKGYNIRFLILVEKCKGDLNCVSERVKEYQDWVRTL